MRKSTLLIIFTHSRQLTTLLAKAQLQLSCNTQIQLSHSQSTVDMSQSTFLQCFEEEHETYFEENTNKEAALKYTASASSKTTNAQTPPRVLVQEPVRSWIRLADAALKSNKVRTNKVLGLMAYPKLNTGVTTEGDVVLMVNIHLVDPVLKAVDAMYPGMLTSYAEEPIDQLRVGRAVKFKPTNKDQVVMLIEFKRCWYIHEDQFEKAMCEPGQAERKFRELSHRDIETTLARCNALWFVKQATAYRANTGCRFVALCDYEHLILLQYPSDISDLTKVHVTVVPRSSFRKALLGFLIHAYEQAMSAK
jgi:hypothetical protein